LTIHNSERFERRGPGRPALADYKDKIKLTYQTILESPIALSCGPIGRKVGASWPATRTLLDELVKYRLIVKIATSNGNVYLPNKENRGVGAPGPLPQTNVPPVKEDNPREAT